MDRIELRGRLRYSEEHGVSVEVEGGSHVVTLADVVASLDRVLEIVDGDEVSVRVASSRGEVVGVLTAAGVLPSGAGPRAVRFLEQMITTLRGADVGAMADLVEVLQEIYGAYTQEFDGDGLTDLLETMQEALADTDPLDVAATADDVGTLAIGAISERARVLAYLRRGAELNPGCRRAQFASRLADQIQRGAHVVPMGEMTPAGGAS